MNTDMLQHHLTVPEFQTRYAYFRILTILKYPALTESVHELVIIIRLQS